MVHKHPWLFLNCNSLYYILLTFSSQTKYTLVHTTARHQIPPTRSSQMSATQQLDALVRETKVTLATKLCTIVAQHEPTNGTNPNPTTLDTEIQSCFTLLDPIHRFIMANNHALPPQIAQNSRKTLEQLKLTILEVSALLAPAPVFNIDTIWNQTLDEFDFEQEMRMCEVNTEAVGAATTNQSSSTTTTTAPATTSPLQTQPTKPKTNATDVRQHVISDLMDCIIIIMTAEQFREILTPTIPPPREKTIDGLTTTPDFGHITNLGTDITSILPHYKPNSLLELTSDLIDRLPTHSQQLITELHRHYSNTTTSLHHLLHAFVQTQTDPEIRQATRSYVYICDLSMEYTSQIIESVSLQPPLILKNLTRTTIVQYGAHILNGDHERSPVTKPFSFASVTAQNITNSTLVVPLIDSSLHITKMMGSVVIGRCHQLRLHFIQSSLFSTSKVSTLACISPAMTQLLQLINIPSQLPDLDHSGSSSGVGQPQQERNLQSSGYAIDGDNNPLLVSLNTITPSHRLEPIIENSQNTIFTPYPIIYPTRLQQELGRNNHGNGEAELICTRLKDVRAKFLTIYDFDSHLDHQDRGQSNIATSNDALLDQSGEDQIDYSFGNDRSRSDQDKSSVQKLHYSYLDQHANDHDLSRILDLLWDIVQ